MNTGARSPGWSWQITSVWCREWEWVELLLRFLIYLHGVHRNEFLRVLTSKPSSLSPLPKVHESQPTLYKLIRSVHVLALRLLLQIIRFNEKELVRNIEFIMNACNIVSYKSIYLYFNLFHYILRKYINKYRPVRKADNLTTILCRCHEIWEP